MEVRAFAPQQRFLRAPSISVAIPEVINVTRRTRSLSRGGFARSGSDRFPPSLKSFSKISFPFCGHNLTAAATAEMTKRQTKFEVRYVNGRIGVLRRTRAAGQRGGPTDSLGGFSS
jgi:hypothetical protein